MEEKKQTNKLSYSMSGKYFRGFLCLLTLCVFSISTALSMYAVGVYGPEILRDTATKYEDTEAFQSDIHNEMSNVLFHCEELTQADMPDGELKILDMSDQKIHYYKKADLGEDIYYDQFTAGYLEDLESYEQREPILVENAVLMNYDSMKQYLLRDDYSCDYVYFDKRTFREVFERDGLKNTNHRFSEDFSEDAYFVFENYEILRRETTSEHVTTEKKAMEENSSSENVTASTQEKKNTEEATTKTEIVITPYSLTSYAVYEPEEDLYYSTADAYFDEMETYIYDADELLSFIEEYEEEGILCNSLVFPLLKSYNTSMYDVAYSGYDSYAITIDVQNVLNSYQSNGIYYYLQVAEDKLYANVENEVQLKNAGNYYRFEKDSNGTLMQEHSEELSDFKDVSSIESYLSGYPTGTVFALAWEKGVAPWSYYDLSFVNRSADYPFYHEYTIVFIVLAVITLFLLLVQTIWLICTTGRQYRGDKNVSLNSFDRLYTEVWAVITGVILFLSGGVAYCFVEEAFYTRRAIYIAGYFALAAVVFGFCFMVLALSFVRRVKGHNLWNQMLLVKLVKYIIRRIKNPKDESDKGEGEAVHEPSAVERAFKKLWSSCKESIYSIKGTRKLLLIFVVFMLIEIVVVFAATASDYYWETSFVVFILLQAVALFAVMRVIKDIDKLADGVREITKGNLDSKVEINEKMSVFGELADGINHIGGGLKSAVETSLKDERMKTELITNVSHDLKTPLTSIINYVDLLKKQEMPNEDAKHYVEVLDGKAQRLKQLTEDLVEAAKATSGNIELEMMPIIFDELMKQALGEFEDKYEKKNLTIIASYPEEPAVVLADGRRLFRIIENVLQNIYKYAMEGTRVYADLSKDEEKITFTLKNVSAAPLNISPDELMERFTRGDSSRTTEGSGLGLSIAKDLTRLQNGEFEIQLDGDLFKVIVSFPVYK